MKDETDDQIYKNIQAELTSNLLDSVLLVNRQTKGIYSALNILFEKAEIGELGLFLKIAENQPVKSETIVQLTEKYLSKSTVYRKLSFYEETGLIMKDQHGYWNLSSELSVLKKVADISKMIEKKKKSQDD